MARDDFSGLLDLFKESFRERMANRKNAGADYSNQSWENTPAGKSYWENKRKKNDDLELEKIKIASDEKIAQMKTEENLAAVKEKVESPQSFAAALLKADPMMKDEDLDRKINKYTSLGKQNNLFVDKYGNPNPADKATVKYEAAKNMSQDAFRDINQTGTGYVETLDKKGKPNSFTRLFNNEGFGKEGSFVREKIGTEAKPKGLPTTPDSPSTSSTTPSVIEQQQKGYEALYPRRGFSLGNVTNVPESPFTLQALKKKKEEEDKKKAQETENIKVYRASLVQ